MFELACTWGLVPEGHRNPAAGIQHYKEKKRDRWVTPEELPRLAQALDRESNIYARYAIWLLVLTGARKSELLRAKWADIDWGRAALRVDESKTGDTRYILLPPPGREMLKKIPRVDGNP
ncbi:MAG: tyrosine-type recombinase/integrase, partial [Shimia sp.]|nr:tyrosine-type recombinase/integrase [Shimia sp.]